MLLVSIFCILCMFARRTVGLVETLPKLPQELQDYFDKEFHIGDLNKNTGHLVFWGCLEKYMSKMMKREELHIPTDVQTKIKAKMTEFMQPLTDPSYRKKRQAQARVRYEIREMPPAALQSYFRAVNMMKRDVLVQAGNGRRPLTMYDMLANLHSGDLIRNAHGGPAFLAWHRIFLWIYESYLRTYVPGVTVPYWGSVLDSEMTNPTQSVIFTSEMFGSGNGRSDGPFADWFTLNPATAFIRSLDEGVDLISYEQYDAVMRKQRNWQIMVPTTDSESNLESIHGGPHVFIGGTMNGLNTAVRDPIFFSHHAFIDKIWEDFRLQQDRNGIPIDSDYPWDGTDRQFRQGHGPEDRTGFTLVDGQNLDGTLSTTNLFNWSNYVGYHRIWSSLVRYAPIPSCTGQNTANTCSNNRYLVCNSNNICSSRTAQEVPARRKRAIMSAEGTCQRKPFINENKYSYIDNTISTPSSNTELGALAPSPLVTPNTNKWVYIPINIIAKRNPSYKRFNDYSLYNGGRYMLGIKNMFIHGGHQKCFKSCSKNQDSVGRMKIMSYGLNYYGYNEEYAIVDNRLGMSQTSGFVPVKNPSDGAKEAMIIVVDSCGRVCRPYSKSQAKAMKKSTGAIRVTNEYPHQYYNNYGDATLNSWWIDSPDAVPEPDKKVIAMTFFCDYMDTWIWNTPTTKKPAPPTGYLDESLLNRTPVTTTVNPYKRDRYPSHRTRGDRYTGRRRGRYTGRSRN